MAPTPHPITITVNNVDNSTALEGAKVYVRNTTKRTTGSEVITDSSGIALIDLANLPVITGQTEPYDTGDNILIIAYYGNRHDAVVYTVTGSSKAQTLNMNYARHIAGLTTEKLKTVIVANTHATVGYYAQVYAIDDGQLMAHVECLAGDTVPVFCDGLNASGGYVIVRESTAVIVTTVIK